MTTPVPKSTSVSPKPVVSPAEDPVKLVQNKQQNPTATVKEVATPLMNKTPDVAKPAERQRKVKPFSLGKLWERFCRLFKNAMKSSDDTTLETSLAPFVTEVTPVKRFDPLDLWPKAPVKAAAESRPTAPARVTETPDKYRNELPAGLNDMAKDLARAKATARPAGVYKPKPQANITGANCYMNSSLQLIQNSRMQYDDALKELVKQDLTMRPNETLKAFEKRALHTWAPIQDGDDVNTEQLRAEIQGLEDELAQAPNDQPLEIRRIKEQIEVRKFELNAILNQDASRFNDRVLFKLSFLLLLQAKAYGSSNQVTEALKNHHKAVFMLDDPYMAFHERRQQLDSALYHNLWHETLGFASYATTFKEAATADGEVYISNHAAVERNPIIKFNLRDEKGVNARSLTEGLDRYFSDTVQNSVQKQKLETILAAKRQELASTSANAVKSNNLKAEIKNLERDYINIAGGEITRPNGTTARVAADVWKPNDNDDLAFEDWSNQRLLLDKPPQFLEIAVDRFYADRTGANQKKIQDKLAFNKDASGKAVGSFTEPVDLSKYFAPEALDENGAKYELIGVSQHQGTSLNGGHYVAYVKSGDQWFCTSDSSVYSYDVTKVPFDSCSVLSYRRV